MPDPLEFRELISGRRRGPLAALARTALAALEAPYTAAVRYRNWRYDTRRAAIHTVGVPVVSVGNLTLGGTGKTPVVEWLARWFSERGVRVGLVSRGYGSTDGQPNDEARELALKLPGVPHVLDADRVRGARRAIDEFGCQLLILDDAFQHRRIARDLNIALVDALEPFGFSHVFPRGTLREPLAGWSRADVVLLTRAQLVDARQIADIRAEVQRHAPHALWCESTYTPHALRTAAGQLLPLHASAGERVAAFCGIGNPESFRRALLACGYQLADLRILADHFPYPAAELTALARWSNSLEVDSVICTDKDLVKVADRWQGERPLTALASQLHVTFGADELVARLVPLADRAADR